MSIVTELEGNYDIIIEDLIEHLEIQKPSEVYDKLWLYHMGRVTMVRKIVLEDMGKWMMFFKNSDMDKMWQHSCNMFDKGKLRGIPFMKCSTSLENPRSSDNTKGVIIFYCGPSTDKCNLLEIGRNLVKYVPYYNKYGYMYYKSDQQTYGGTRKTGQIINSLYRLSVPKCYE